RRESREWPGRAILQRTSIWKSAQTSPWVDDGCERAEPTESGSESPLRSTAEGSASGRRPLRGREETPKNRQRTRWATRNHDVHRNHVAYAPPTRVALSKDSPACPAVPNGDDQFRIWRRVVGPEQRLLHVHRNGPGDQEDVRMARAGHETDSRSFEVVIRVVESVDLQLAPVARPSIDGSQTQGSAEHSKERGVELLPLPLDVVRRGQRLAEDAGSPNLFQDVEHR